jgi:hypothetical protein
LRVDRTCVGPTSARRTRCRTTRRVKDSAGVSNSTRGDIIGRVDDITADDTFDDTATAVYDANVADVTRGDSIVDDVDDITVTDTTRGDTAADDTTVNNTAADDATRGDNGAATYTRRR